MARIYVASSWRNQRQPKIVEVLRDDGHAVYDFRNPDHGLGRFAWSQIDPNWKSWSPIEYRDHLTRSSVAAHGFMTDQRALAWCDTCVLVMPCGRSAHLELGWAAGAGKHTAILLEGGEGEYGP